MALSVITVALALQALPAPNANIAWAELPRQTGHRAFIDPGSIRRDGSMVRYILRVAPDQGAGQPFALLISREIADCAGRRYGHEEMRVYAADGRLLAERAFLPADIEMIAFNDQPSDTAIYRRVCGAAR